MRAARLAASAALLALSAVPAAAQHATAKDAGFANLPDWSGLWIPVNDTTSISGLPDVYQKARESGKTPPKLVRLNGPGAPWNAEGQRRMAEARAATANCRALGWGFPMLMNAEAPIQFFVTPKKVLVINGYRDVMDVRIGEKHPSPDDLWPTVWGDSVGHWEGKTLVVDTIEVKNPHDYFHGAPPLSEKAHYVQRIYMDKPHHLVDDITITDPVTLTGPWKSHLTFMPAKGFGRIIYDTYDNDRTQCGKDSGIAPSKDETKQGEQ